MFGTGRAGPSFASCRARLSGQCCRKAALVWELCLVLVRPGSDHIRNLLVEFCSCAGGTLPALLVAVPNGAVAGGVGVSIPLRQARNSQLRTGTDQGNPTV